VQGAGPISGSRSFLSKLCEGDEIARLVTFIFAATVVLITVALVYELWISSALPRHKFGLHFFVGEAWDPVMDEFGALPFIYGTLVTSAVSPGHISEHTGRPSWSMMTLTTICF